MIEIDVKKTEHGLSISFPDKQFERTKEIKRVESLMEKREYHILCLLCLDDAKWLEQMCHSHNYVITAAEKLPDPYTDWVSATLRYEKN